MATPWFLELPPAYNEYGEMMTSKPGQQISDFVMCSECRCLLNRHNQSDHIKVHEESDSLRRLLMELVTWKTSLLQCPECRLMYPPKDKAAHDLFHGYLEDCLNERPLPPPHDSNNITLSTASMADLLSGLGMREPDPAPVRYRTYKPAEIEWSTTNSILGVTTTRLAFPIDADGDGIDDAVCSLEYDNHGNLTISEQP